MQKSIIPLLVIGLLTMYSCNQKPDVTNILEDQETREDVFKTIVDNHDYMMGFMETMQNSENAMQMMQGNKPMMGNIMKGPGMRMMMNDSMMMKNMMGNKNMMKNMMHEMMNDSTQMNRMMEMMNQKGMMSTECMQSFKKMRQQKGKMGSMK